MQDNRSDQFKEFETQQKHMDDLSKSHFSLYLKNLHFGFGIKGKLKKAANALLGTKIAEYYWGRKYKNKKNMIVKEFEAENFRLYFLQKLNEMDYSSALEIGCNWGPNLQMIASNRVVDKLVGIDISKDCIEVGTELFAKSTNSNVLLIHGKATELNKEVQGKYDLVYSWACLMYISGSDIKNVMKQILGKAEKRILLAEFHTEEVLGSMWDNHWVHNFSAIINDLDTRINSVTFTKITEMDMSPTWRKYGCYIDIRLKDN